MATVVRTQECVDTRVVTETQESASPSLVLKLRKPKSDKAVKWTDETVDNEHMGKKSSKCCCIYEKPKTYGHDSTTSDSSSGDDDNSYEKKTKKEKKMKKKAAKHDCSNHDHASDHPSTSNNENADT